MDEEISNWVIEFLLRQPISNKIINGVLSSLPLTNTDSRLKKTLLLRRIELETSTGTISEKTLDSLEIIEELDHTSGKTASFSMRQAYCSVAIDCTVRFLDENVERNGKYFEAVRRVWRDRVCKVEGLVSEELTQWISDIEAAVWDSGACKRIMMKNTRNEALNAVKVYLSEAWAGLGPAFLELVAERFGDALEGVSCGSGGSGNPCREMVVFEGSQKDRAPLRRKHVARKNKRRRGATISDASEWDEDEPVNNSKRHRGLNTSGGDGGNEDEFMQEGDGVPNPEVERAHIDQTLSSTGTTNKDNIETVVKNRTGPKMHTTAEVDRLRKAFKSSSMELRAVVKDPLPEALETAEYLSSTMSNHTMRNEGVTNAQTGQESTKKKDNPTHDAQNNGGQQHRKKLLSLPRPSLLEPNGTGHTFEWDDSMNDLPEGSLCRPRLPSPKAIKVSPLISYDMNSKFTRRRVRKIWTSSEEDALRDGVQKFGKGNWKLILHSHRDVFQDRTEVDLKDKWRNMTRPT